MKPKIHPDFHKIMVSCACGNSFETFSTSKELKVEVCSSCHPFFTGTQRFVDTAGRVERFKTKIEAQKKIAAEKTAKAKPRLAKAAINTPPKAAKPAEASEKTAANPEK